MARIAQNTLALTVARIVERATNFVLAALIGTQLGIDSFGIYAASTALFGFLLVGASLGASTFMAREVGRDLTRASETLFDTLVLLVGGGLLISAGAWIVLPYVGFPDSMVTSSRIIVLALVPGLIGTVLTSVLTALGRSYVQTIVSIALGFAMVGASAAAIFLGADVNVLVAIFAAAQLVGMLCYVVIVRRGELPFALHTTPARVRATAHGTRYFAASTAVGALFSRPEILILSSLGSERQVGLYAAALKLFEAWTVVSESFLASTFPRLVALAKRSKDEMLSFARDASGAIAAVSVALVVALVVFAGDILVAVFGDAFEDGATTLQIGAPSMLFYGLFSLHWRVLAALDRQPTVLRIQLMTAPLRIVLGVILTLLAGAAGAAASATISLGVHTTIQGRAAFPGPWRSLVRPAVRLGIVALTVGLPTYLGDRLAGFPGGVAGWGLGCLIAATRVTPETVSFFRYRMEI